MMLCNLLYIIVNIFYILCDFNYVSAVATSDTLTTNQTNDIVISYESECRDLCESCDCKGFFCGDNECICECNANINKLNKYAECLKDLIKDNFYKYNISVQHLNAPSTDDKNSAFVKNTMEANKAIKKRSIVWEMQPEGTNYEKEKIFKVDSDLKLTPLNFDFVGSSFSGLKGLGGLSSFQNLGKNQEVGASILGTDTVAAAAPSPMVAASSPLVGASSPLVAASLDTVAASSTDPLVGAAAGDSDVGMAAIKAKKVKAIEIGKLAGILGKMKAIKLKPLAVKKGLLLGDAQDVGAAADSIISQPAQTM